MARDEQPLTFLRSQPWISTLSRLALAGVWLFAGVEKFIHTEDTVRATRAYQLLPESLVRPWAYGMPIVEIILGLLLLLGLVTRLAALGSAIMLMIFLFGISAAWARGLSIECGCFGGGGATVANPVPGYVREIARDLLYLALAVWLIRWPRSRFSLDSALGITRDPGQAHPSFVENDPDL